MVDWCGVPFAEDFVLGRGIVYWLVCIRVNPEVWDSNPHHAERFQPLIYPIVTWLCLQCWYEEDAVNVLYVCMGNFIKPMLGTPQQLESWPLNALSSSVMFEKKEIINHLSTIHGFEPSAVSWVCLGHCLVLLCLYNVSCCAQRIGGSRFSAEFVFSFIVSA